MDSELSQEFDTGVEQDEILARGGMYAVGTVPGTTWKALVLIGVIVTLFGLLLELMVRGDPQLRRPYVVAIANASRIAGANVAGAKELAAFLRNPQTQEWIRGYGVSQLDDQPLFFPVEQ